MQVKIGLLVALPLGLLLAGCGRHDGAQPAAKLAARVNGTEITVQQIAIGANPAEPSASAGASRAPGIAQALDQVIDRELLAQQALKEKLDADPQVVRAIEEARRQVLAQAWLDRVARKSGVGAKEVSAFYAENPALFAQRRVYRIRELGVAGDGSGQLTEQVRGELTGARDLDEVAGWLKWRNLKVSPVTGATQPAEQLPLSYLSQLARMREGDIAVFPTAYGVSVVQLVQAQDAPLSEQEAAPVIEKFLSGRRKLEVAAAETKRLRATAQIEYVGDFKR